MKRNGGTRRGLVQRSVLLVALVTSAVLAAPMSGDAAAPPPPSDMISAPDIAEVSLARDRGISLAEARTRLSWQPKAGDLQDRLAGVRGFGGVWIDVADGDRVKVGMTRVADLRRSVAAASLTGAVDLVQVRYGYRQLEDANSWLADRLAPIDARTAYPLIPSLRPDRNAVELRVPAGRTLTGEQRTLVREAKARYGTMLITGTYTGRPQSRACRYPYCDPPLRGGIRIQGATAGCTAAFLARSRSDRLLYQFTAGHCALDGNTGTWTTRFATGQSLAIGAIGGRWRFATGVGDMAIIQVAKPSDWDAHAWVNVTASSYTTANSQYPIRADGGTVVGMRICTTGAYYGKSDCGNVQHVGVPLTYEGVRITGLAEGNFCGTQGDSGAPMYAGTVAYGLQVAGLATCDSFYQGIHAAEDALNVDVAFSP